MNSSGKSALLVAGGLGGIVTAYLLLLFLPQKRTIEGLRAEIAEKQAVVAESPALTARRLVLEQELLATAEYVRCWEGGTDESADVARLFGQIAHVARQSGSDTTAFKPEPAVAYETFSRIGLRIACKGGLPQIHEMLLRLEQMPQRVWIDHVRIERPGKEGAVCTAELRLEVFAGRSDFSDQSKGDGNR